MDELGKELRYDWSCPGTGIEGYRLMVVGVGPCYIKEERKRGRCID